MAASRCGAHKDEPRSTSPWLCKSCVDSNGDSFFNFGDKNFCFKCKGSKKAMRWKPAPYAMVAARAKGKGKGKGKDGGNGPSAKPTLAQFQVDLMRSERSNATLQRQLAAKKAAGPPPTIVEGESMDQDMEGNDTQVAEPDIPTNKSCAAFKAKTEQIRALLVEDDGELSKTGAAIIEQREADLAKMLAAKDAARPWDQQLANLRSRVLRSQRQIEHLEKNRSSMQEKLEALTEKLESNTDEIAAEKAVAADLDRQQKTLEASPPTTLSPTHDDKGANTKAMAEGGKVVTQIMQQLESVFASMPPSPEASAALAKAKSMAYASVASLDG